MGTHESRLKITLLEDVTRKARGITSALGSIERQASSFTAPIRSVTGQLLAFGGAYLGVSQGIKSTAGSAIAFESAFADVRKVVDANEEQFDNLRRTIRQMSTELPIAANDIAALFAAAGESGVATEDLKAFSEMAARVGIAFDMSAGDAGESLAKLKTQLGLTVAETGEMADAINHLSNNMASKAKDITAYMLRVGALAEMGGFTKEAIAGIGSAMIAGGAQAEVAATAMQNVVKALTRGESAKAGQKAVAKALGLDLPQIAKEMQKDAPKAMKKVLQAIGKAPKDRHLALLSDFFGDEAKAFAPLVGNIGLLEQALDSVSDKTRYSGSAFKEYVERSKTTANTLELLSNKVSNVFWAMGDQMLPTINAAALGMGSVLDTLGSRVSIFDEMEAGIKGFAQGLGYGGIREVIEDIGDLFFGKIDPTAGDQLGRIFMQAKDWGASIRELNSAISENPIAQFFGDIAPYGLQIMAWGAGIAFLTSTIKGLASALFLLSGASTILAALRAAGSIASIVGGGAAATAATTAAAGTATAGATGGALAGGSPWLMRALGLFGAGLGGLAVSQTLGWGSKGTPEQEQTLQKMMNERAARYRANESPDPYAADADKARDEGHSFNVFGGVIDQLNRIAGSLTLPDISYAPKLPRTIGQEDYIKLDQSSIDAMAQPRGVQQVEVTNPPPRPNVNMPIYLTVNGVTDPEKLANEISGHIGQRLRDEMAGIYADTGYGAA